MDFEVNFDGLGAKNNKFRGRGILEGSSRCGTASKQCGICLRVQYNESFVFALFLVSLWYLMGGDSAKLGRSCFDLGCKTRRGKGRTSYPLAANVDKYMFARAHFIRYLKIKRISANL